jgi:hypothetical protein
MKKVIFSAVLLASVLMIGCKKDKAAEEPNEEELITTVNLKFKNVATNATTTFTYKDLDGPGGAAPQTFQTIALKPSTIYDVSVELLDESSNPVKDITSEVSAEGVDHQFYYNVSGGTNAAFSNLNNDSNGLPLGLTARCVTTSVGNVSLQFILKHKPGVKAANDPSSKGETDVEITWPITVAN